MLPAARMVKEPLLTVILPRLRAWLLARAALPAAVVVKVTVPLKALAALPRLMEPLLAVTVAVPLTATAVLAAWVMAPLLAMTVKLPLAMATLPRLRALLLRRLTSAAAPVMRATAPLKALAALARLMAP